MAKLYGEMANRGVVRAARSYVLMAAASDPAQKDGGITIEARERTAMRWVTSGPCGELYYRESGPNGKTAKLQKKEDVLEYGGRTFAQPDWEMKPKGEEPWFERILSTCSSEKDAPNSGFYLSFHVPGTDPGEGADDCGGNYEELFDAPASCFQVKEDPALAVRPAAPALASFSA